MYEMIGKTQHIRRSQFVLTYGPGAIIESRKGPRLIPSLSRGLGDLFSADKIRNFEITDSRLRTILKNMGRETARIFSLPSNAALGKPDSRSIYMTYVFPTWKICYNKDEHQHGRYIFYPKSNCPVCGKAKHSSHVRFVVACSKGHLDEVHWNYAVHLGQEGKNRCNPPYFFWHTGGSSLSDIVVECPQCGARVSMQDIYQMDFNCTARSPEKEFPYSSGGTPSYTNPQRRMNCDATMKVIQRQSSSLRFPETITLLTIPEYDNAISNILQRTEIASAIDMLLSFSGIDKEEMIDKIMSNRNISNDASQRITDHITTNGVDDFRSLFRALHNEERTFMDFIYEEFESLSEGSRVTDNFSMSPPKIMRGVGDILPSLSVYPINMLRTVTAQFGYMRLPSGGGEPETVSSGAFLDGSLWYPGFEGIGEGVFITFHNSSPELDGLKAYGEWKNGESWEGGNPLWDNVYEQPLFIWLHTLSHSIIKALSLYSGYSSASLRERVYIDRNGQNGGILIYTTSPGEDGSMGGLVGAVDKFDHILRRALENIRLCSNDPLCRDVRKSAGKVNGAACYSCLLISETSCEHRNMALDRHVIIGD